VPGHALAASCAVPACSSRPRSFQYPPAPSLANGRRLARTSGHWPACSRAGARRAGALARRDRRPAPWRSCCRADCSTERVDQTVAFGKRPLPPSSPLRCCGPERATPTLQSDGSHCPAKRSISHSRSPNAGQELDVYAEAGATSQRRPPTQPAQRFTAAELAQRFTEAHRHFEQLRNRARIDTPDPYSNASMAAFNVAADAAWDEGQGAIMHGAIDWRTKLLGWRGPYALDALGWHVRARRNFEQWFPRQNTGPIAAALPPADPGANLARNESGRHGCDAGAKPSPGASGPHRRWICHGTRAATGPVQGAEASYRAHSGQRCGHWFDGADAG